MGDRLYALSPRSDENGSRHGINCKYLTCFFKKIIYFLGGACIFARNDREHIIRRPLTIQSIRRLYYPVKCTLSAHIDAVEVVYLCRAIKRQTYKVIVLLKKFRPVVINQKAVGLYAVVEYEPFFAYFFSISAKPL